MKNLEILVVDDEIEVVELLKEILEEKGHKIYCAKDGNEALNLIEKRSFDLILLDNQMPRKSGEELLKDISKIVSRTFKIVFISGGNKNLLQLVEENDCYHVVDYVLNKPFSVRYIEDIILELFNSQH